MYVYLCIYNNYFITSLPHDFLEMLIQKKILTVFYLEVRSPEISPLKVNFPPSSIIHVVNVDTPKTRISTLTHCIAESVKPIYI